MARSRAHAAPALLAALALVLAAAACEDDGDDGPIPQDSTLNAVLSPLTGLQGAGTVSVTDAAGGAAGDRMTVAVTVGSDSFDALGIDDADGLDDETVLLVVERQTSDLFSVVVPFADDRRDDGEGDISFEVTVSGPEVPDVRVGDEVTVLVNGAEMLGGTFVAGAGG
jgi:hypothetical protein